MFCVFLAAAPSCSKVTVSLQWFRGFKFILQEVCSPSYLLNVHDFFAVENGTVFVHVLGKILAK